MENLNAEKVKKALEWAIEKEFCENCLCTAYGKSIVEFHKETLAIINSQEQRIKELAEEKDQFLDTIVCLEIDLEKAKANAVREMQAEIINRCLKGGIYPAFVATTIDKIAKEMLDEG